MLLFFPSRWLGLAVFAPVGRFLSLGDGVLQRLAVKTVGFEHQPFRVQKFRLKPGPGQLFRRHAMVFEKSAGREGRGSKDAHSSPLPHCPPTGAGRNTALRQPPPPAGNKQTAGRKGRKRWTPGSPEFPLVLLPRYCFTPFGPTAPIIP